MKNMLIKHDNEIKADRKLKENQQRKIIDKKSEII